MAKAKSSKPQSKSNDRKVNVDGRVVEVLPDTKYKVEIEVGGVKHVLMCYPSGSIRTNYIKIAENDEVVVEMSPEYDMNIGRVIWKKNARGTVPASISDTVQDELEQQNNE